MGMIKGLMERPYIGRGGGGGIKKGIKRQFCYSEEASSKLLGNTDNFLQDYMAPNPRRCNLIILCCKNSGSIREMLMRRQRRMVKFCYKMMKPEEKINDWQCPLCLETCNER
jgi:hypothetical protein